MWVIYYSDSEFSSEDGGPESAPARDVQVIVQSDEESGWVTQTGTDYYAWIGDRWQGRDVFGLWDYLTGYGWKRVLFGRMITNEEYDAVMTVALNDPRLPKKTSGGRRERWVRK
jgi:hypothetical protein